MANTVEVRGIEYPVEKFTNNHLQKISEMLVIDSQGHSNLGSLSLQSECAEVVLEVMVPTLPDDAISVSPRGKYIWQLDLVEIPVLLLQLVKVWRLRQIEVAKARKDKAAIELHQGHLQAIEDYLAEFTPLLESSDSQPAEAQGGAESGSERIAQLEQELARLKALEAADSELVTPAQQGLTALGDAESASAEIPTAADE